MNNKTEIITAKNNPQIKAAAALTEKKERENTGLFLLEGARLCKDAALNGIVIEKLFVTQEAAEKYRQEFAAVSEKAQRVFLIGEDAAKKLADTKNSQNMFCVCRKNGSVPDIRKEGMYVFLDNIQNPDNLGAVVRTAEALGADGLIVSSGCDIFSPKAMRASMGALLRFPVIAAENGEELLTRCKENGMRVFATVPDSAAADITKTRKTGGCVLVIGNEGSGVSPGVLSLCTDRITIPMKGKAESLNAAAAAAIAIWEFMKER